MPVEMVSSNSAGGNIEGFVQQEMRDTCITHIQVEEEEKKLCEKQAEITDPIVIEDIDLSAQCSPPAKGTSAADVIAEHSSSPMNQDSAQSKKGTGRKRAAFASSSNNSNRRGQAKKATSPESGEQCRLIENFLSPVKMISLFSPSQYVC
jgi:hypothetical protein